MRIRRRTSVLGVLVLMAAAGLATTAAADGIPGFGWEQFELFAAFVEMDPAALEATVFARPDGAGPPLTQAFAAGGTPVDATITLTIVDPLGDPIGGLPAEEFWLVSAAGGMMPCDLVHPDGPTDVNGQVTWSLPPAVGGHSVGDHLRVVVAGAMLQTEIPLTVKTPDLSGDRFVNLTDIAVFVPAIGTGAEACDFNNDGDVDLADVARFVPAIGAGCP